MIASADSVFVRRSPSPVMLGQALAALGRTHAVVFDELMGAPLVLRHKEVAAGLKDTATFSTKFYGMGPMSDAMIALDGRDHQKQRRIHNRFFSASASAKYAAMVEPIAARTFGAFAGRDRAELVEEAIARYPMEVFLALLGIPDDLGDRGLLWVRAIINMLGSPLDESLVGAGNQAFDELGAYTRELVENERLNPGDNMLGEIIRAHDSEGSYSPEAVTVAVISLLLGGFETTIQMLTGTISSLLLHPEALQRVRANPALIDNAIDEAFRWANPSAGLYRLVLRDTEIAGTPVAAGSMVYFCIAGAHFDDQVYAAPDVFDLDRRSGAHLGFGAGPHYCAGAPLAKIEVRAALTSLLDACPGLRLDPEQELSFYYGARGFVQHGTDALPVLCR